MRRFRFLGPGPFDSKRPTAYFGSSALPIILLFSSPASNVGVMTIVRAGPAEPRTTGDMIIFGIAMPLLAKIRDVKSLTA